MRDILTRLADAAGLLANQVQLTHRSALEGAVAAEMVEAVLSASELVNSLVLEAHAELRGWAGRPAHEAQETILEEAGRLTSGDRQADYGHPIDDFTRTGRLWGALLGLPGDVSPEQVGLCMVAVKLSRQCNRPKRDNLVDGAGYLRTVEMIERERERRAVDVEQDAADYHGELLVSKVGERVATDVHLHLTPEHTVEQVGSVMVVDNEATRADKVTIAAADAPAPRIELTGGKKYLVFTDSWPAAKLWADSHQLSSYDWDWVSDRSDLGGRSPAEYEGVLLSVDAKNSGAEEAWAEWQSCCG